MTQANSAPDEPTGYTWAQEAEAEHGEAPRSLGGEERLSAGISAAMEQSGYAWDGEAEEDEMSNFAPRGTLLFLLIMLLGYALYWAYLWFVVVIERGAGGT